MFWIKKFLKMGMTSMLSMVMLSSFWEFPFCGPSAFFFGEPEFPYNDK